MAIQTMPEPMTGKDLAMARVLIFGASFCGRVSLLAFMLFLFSGPFAIINLRLSHDGWLVWDAMLSFLFFVQHSSMIRRGLRARLAKHMSGHYHGAVFTIASGMVLLVVVIFWQTSGMLLFDLQGPARWMARGIFLTATLGIAWGARALKGFDPYGTGPIRARLSGRPSRSQQFSIQGPYKWVRHPLYFFVLVLLWSGSTMTADRLLFNLLWSGWIYVGAVLEEKDLVSEFGNDYRNYQTRVPMLIPWKGFKIPR